MKCCSVRFYAELNDFFPGSEGKLPSTISFPGSLPLRT